MKKRFEKILKGLYRYELEKIYIPLKNGSEALEMAINLLTNLDANIAMSTTFCFKKKTRVTRICEKLLSSSTKKSKRVSDRTTDLSP